MYTLQYGLTKISVFCKSLCQSHKFMWGVCVRLIKCNYDLSYSSSHNSLRLNIKGAEMRTQFLTTEDVVMHCACKRVSLLLEEKPQEMEIEVFLSVSLV